MADEALCRLTALTDEQLAGLAAVAAMDTGEVAEFQQRIDDVWAANRQAVQDTKRRMVDARRHQAEVETRCGVAARARYLAAGGVGLCVLNDAEQAEVQAACEGVSEAEAEMRDAMARFKDGVTAADLEAA